MLAVKIVPENRNLPEEMVLNFDPEEAVSLTLLTSPVEPASSIRITSILGRRIEIASRISVQAGTPVRLEWSKYLVLAEVLHPEGPIPAAVLYIRHVLDLDQIQPIQRKWMNP